MAVNSRRPTAKKTPASNATDPERDSIGPPGIAGGSIRFGDDPVGGQPGDEAVAASSALISNGAALG
jgi:hypothetical protein